MWFIITWTTNPTNARGVQVKKKKKKEKNNEGANFKVRAERTQNTLEGIEGLQHENWLYANQSTESCSWQGSNIAHPKRGEFIPHQM